MSPCCQKGPKPNVTKDCPLKGWICQRIALRRIGLRRIALRRVRRTLHELRCSRFRRFCSRLPATGYWLPLLISLQAPHRRWGWKRGQEPFLGGGVVLGCFASMFSLLRTAGGSLRLGELAGSALGWRSGSEALECGELSPLSHVAERRRTRLDVPHRRLVVRQEQDTSMLR